MAKTPGLSAAEAFRLESYQDAIAKAGVKAVEKYKADIVKKLDPSAVLQPGGVSGNVPAQRRFKNFAEAYEYTKNNLVN